MIRPLHTWILFGLCVVLAATAMGWVSWTALRLDRAESLARRQAEFEENVRLALWRMDSKLAPLIAQESGRPYFFYATFYPAERSYNCMSDTIQPDETPVPSPLLWFSAPQIVIHFQIDPSGAVASPQMPEGQMKWIADNNGFRPPSGEIAAEYLPRIASLAHRGALLAALPKPEPFRPTALPTGPVGEVQVERTPAQPPAVQQIEPIPWARGNLAAQQQKSSQEWTKRSGSYANVQAVISQQQRGNLPFEPGPPVVEGFFKPLWLNDLLLLARRVSTQRGEFIQGCVLNWPVIREELLAEIADLLPAAHLEPVAVPDAAGRSSRELAALPVKLVPGPMPADPARAASPIRMSLMTAWGCVLMAAVAVAALLIGAVTLSERRGAFVSAVTHELRTPLTTLRMYTEMLADGMVRDDAQRRAYFQTLRAEADRLGHLVENVLAYSRIERGRAGGLVTTLPVGELLERARGRLAERAAQAGMNLLVELNGQADRPVRADPSAVEQILFNLVDNACKYAAGAADRSIVLEAAGHDGATLIRVRDHGPGISAREGRRLFRPFCKSAREAAHSAPGVGLGLALSRRLAREMGGELRLEPTAGGASFLLSLPAA
ncbi:MAG: hypothetical protein AMXMBFR83_11290 [Phycisphaerae bacterium]